VLVKRFRPLVKPTSWVVGVISAVGNPTFLIHDAAVLVVIGVRELNRKQNEKFKNRTVSTS